jgi:hypothetical protein
MLNHLHRESCLATFSGDIEVPVFGLESYFGRLVRCTLPNADGALLALNPNFSLAHGEENLPQQMGFCMLRPRRHEAWDEYLVEALPASMKRALIRTCGIFVTSECARC